MMFKILYYYLVTILWFILLVIHNWNNIQILHEICPKKRSNFYLEIGTKSVHYFAQEFKILIMTFVMRIIKSINWFNSVRSNSCNSLVSVYYFLKARYLYPSVWQSVCLYVLLDVNLSPSMSFKDEAKDANRLMANKIPKNRHQLDVINIGFVYD